MNANHARLLALLSAILAAAALRLVPHPPNFTPIGAMALFSGAYLGRRGLAFVAPIAALLLSDLVLGFYHGMATVYGNMGQVYKGLHLLRDTVEEIRQRQTTRDDDGTLETSILDAMHDLANMYDHVSKDDEALLWYSRTVEGYQGVLGKNHPTTRKEAEKLSELRSRMKQ